MRPVDRTHLKAPPLTADFRTVALLPRLALGITVFASASTAVARQPAPVAPLRPSASAESYVTTESSDVLPAWTPSAILLSGYGQATARTSGTSSPDVTLQRRTTTHLLFALGLFDWVELGLHMPVVVHQRGGITMADGSNQSLVGSAVGDLRVGLKGTVLHTPDRGFGLGLAFDVTAPTGQTTALAGEGAVTYAPQILLRQRMVRGIEAALNLGYWARPNREANGVMLGDLMTYRLALRVPFGRYGQVAALAEMDGGIAPWGGQRQHPMVLRAGLQGRIRSGFVIGAYGGGAAVPGFGVPDVHAIVSFGYVPPHKVRAERAFDGSPRPTAHELARRHARLGGARLTKAPEITRHPDDPDGDKLLAAVDRCPHVAEDFDDFQDGDGCPEQDNDRDGVRDADDLCPVAPELINGYADWDGCPDRRFANGKGKTYARFDPALLLPSLSFEAGATGLDEDSQRDLTELAELVRLNPWIGHVTIEIRVHASNSAVADRRTAELRAYSVQRFLLEQGIDPLRIAVAEPRAVPAGHPERVRVAIGGRPEGNDVMGPSSQDLQRMIAEANGLAGSAPTPPGGVMAQGPDEQ